MNALQNDGLSALQLDGFTGLTHTGLEIVAWYFHFLASHQLLQMFGQQWQV